MSGTKFSKIRLGGNSAFNWIAFLLLLGFLILEIPLLESKFDYIWVFWRWFLVVLLASIPTVTLFALGDLYFFQNREKKPMANWSVFAYGFLLGFVFGALVGAISFWLNLQNYNIGFQILTTGVNDGLAGMLLMPLSSLIGSSVTIYNSDREALIAERLLVESQKTESKAVINSLKLQLSHQVDENLLRIIENSKEFFNTKSRSLEENWELLAERLRSAALDTIRPFSHRLHRRSEEVNYRVRINELASYIAYKFEIYPLITTLVFLVTTHQSYSDDFFSTKYLLNLLLKTAVFFMLLQLLKQISKWNKVRNLYAFFPILIGTGFSQVLISNFLSVKYIKGFTSNYVNYLDGLLVSGLIFLISLSMTLVRGGHAEMEFLERRISEEQLETMLLRREEARISRELAKYLHGTIQSRLMASAMGLEVAGKGGDMKALKKEARNAYKNLRLPSESYFSTPENSLREEIDKVTAKWRNLIEIKVKLGRQNVSLSADLIQDLGHVINEGLSNAFRHGHADKVNIEIKNLSSSLEIEIVDNGDGPSKGKGGLGSEWFNAIAGSNWDLRANTKQGSTLWLKIPVH